MSFGELDQVGGWAVRYVTSDTWAALRQFDDEMSGIPLRHHQRRLVLLAAYCGSPASQIAAAIEVDASVVIMVGKGRTSFAWPRALERLHDWIKASLWRHLWRTGSANAHTAGAIMEARAHAESVAAVPWEWSRDWRIACDEVRR